MPDFRKQVHTLSLRQPRYFDDRLWPTNVALVALALFVAGICVVENHVVGSRSWGITIFEVVVVAVLLAASLWAVRVTGPARTERIKLCFVLSLLAHAALLVAMHHHYLRFFIERPEPAQIAVVQTRFEEDVPPEVIIQPPLTGDEQREIDRPVATGTPHEQTDRLTQERTTPKMLEAIRQSHPLPEPQSQPAPQLVRARRPQPSMPLRAPSAGRRSRRETNASAEPNSSPTELAADVPSQPARAEAKPTPTSDAARLARAQAVTPALEMPNQPAEPDSARRAVVEALAAPRRQSEQPRPQETVAMVPRTRQTERPARLREQQIENDQQVTAVQQRRAEALAPVTQELERSVAAAPVLAKMAPVAVPDELAMTTTRPLPRQVVNERLPQVAHERQAAAQRRRVDLAEPLAAEATTRKLAELTATRGRQVAAAEPTYVTLARAPDANLAASASELPDATESASSTARVAPRAQLSRIAQSHVPSIQTDRSDTAKSREDQPVAQLAAAGTERIREMPTMPTAQGAGGGTPVSAAPRADSERSALARSASAAIIGQPTEVGGPETSAVGRLAEEQLPARRPTNALAGETSRGGPQRPRRNRGPLPAAAVESTATSLATTAVGSAAPPSDSPSTTAAAPTDAGDLPRTAAADSPNFATGDEAFQPANTGTRSSQPLATVGPRPLQQAGGSAPSIDADAATAMSRRRTPTAAPAPTATAATTDPTTAIAVATQAGNNSRAAVQPTPGAPRVTLGRAASSVPVRIEAVEGAGGLGVAPSRPVGLPDRRAGRQAELAHAAPSRLIQKQVGGNPSISGAARVPAAAFSQRGRRKEELLTGGEGKPSARTEAAIELGLEFLARLQLADGRWSFQNMGGNADFAAGERPILRADAASTGLALLAFLGAGYDHYDDKYQAVVQNGLDYLIRVQQPSGEIFPDSSRAGSAVTRFYGHGIAALALSEALGMTGDENLRRPAQQALDYLAETQHPQRGGWRYMPGVNSDLSVTGWQLMALRSGQLAGLYVDPQTFQRVSDLVESCREPGGDRFRFCYNPWASATDPRTRHGRQPSTVMTAVGLLAQLYLGGNRNQVMMQGGANHLMKNLPEMGSSQRLAPTGTLTNPLRDTYYWYYATQVMFHMGGEYWKAWNDKLHPLLVDTQTPVGPLAGSWNPERPVPDKWGRHGGRLYVTTMNLLSLEVYYRHLPLYEMTAK